MSEFKVGLIVPPAETLSEWLSDLPREELVQNIAEGIAWSFLTRETCKQTPLSIAEAIVCYLEEKRDGKN